MLLPNAEKAVVEIEKLRDYCLNPNHERGAHKARVFRAALGISIDDAEWLKQQVLQNVQATDAQEKPASIFGSKFVVDMIIDRDGLSAKVRTSWIVELGTDYPRLTSCYVI